MKVLPPKREPKTRTQSLEEKLKHAKKELAKAVRAKRDVLLRHDKAAKNVASLEAKMEKKRG